jgi:hypothetical protein
MRKILYVLLLLALGCATFGIPTPQTFNERLAAGYTTATTIVAATTTLLAAKKLSSADAENVLKQTDTAVAGLDISRNLSLTDLAAANTKLTATLVVLNSLQAYLNSKKGTS